MQHLYVCSRHFLRKPKTCGGSREFHGSNNVTDMLCCRTLKVCQGPDSVGQSHTAARLLQSLPTIQQVFEYRILCLYLERNYLMKTKVCPVVCHIAVQVSRNICECRTSSIGSIVATTDKRRMWAKCDTLSWLAQSVLRTSSVKAYHFMFTIAICARWFYRTVVKCTNDYSF